MTSQSSRSSSFRWSLVIAVAITAAIAAPRAASAQQTDSTARPATHTVKKGDTLWDLARVYLGDPFLWPEIYRINTDVVEDPHWIYPGEILRIPGGQGGEPAVVAEITPSNPDNPADTGVTEEIVESSGPTMFRRPSQRGSVSSQRQNGKLIDDAPAVRAGEYYAAPFVISDRERKHSGTIISTAEMPGIAAAHIRETIQNEERIYVHVPSDNIPAAGDLYLTYKMGPDIPNVGQIVIPTGIVKVERPGSGEATIVRVERQFQDMRSGQKLIPLDKFVSPPAADRVPVEGGPESKIAWILGDPALASLQSYVIVPMGTRAGVKLGDEFRVYRERTKVEDGNVLPAEGIATALVVRVTDATTTLVISGQQNPAIREGARAQLSARMP